MSHLRPGLRKQHHQTVQLSGILRRHLVTKRKEHQTWNDSRSTSWLSGDRLRHSIDNSMSNRQNCLLVLLLLCTSIGALAQNSTGSYPGTGNGQDNTCSASDPNCQQNGQDYGRGTIPPPASGTTITTPPMQQGESIYVDSAGQIRQGNPGQSYPNQNYPNNQANQYQGSGMQQQEPDPITDFQRLVTGSTGQLVPIYGRQLFRGVPTTFAPVDQTPVTPDYVIGPGDELLIRVWGQVVFNDRLTVDRSGTIYIPKVGSVHVSGIPFSGLDKHLRSEIGRVFRNFDLNVNMGQLRSIQVFVLGQARRPGSYTVSSLSTLINALFASGGPSVQGSMRSIQLRRNGKTISDLDLYALISKGDKSQDLRLLPGDVIFIPPAGSQVAMTGSVRIPGIYELKGETTLEDVIQLAGGFSTTASNTRATLERIEEHRVRAAAEITMDTAGKAIVLRDGDVVRVFSITGKYDKTVILRGNLANPGRFAWHSGMKLSELIPEREALLTNQYWRNHNLLGLPGPMLFEPISPANLNRILNPPTQNYPRQLPGQMPDSQNNLSPGGLDSNAINAMNGDQQGQPNNPNLNQSNNLNNDQASQALDQQSQTPLNRSRTNLAAESETSQGSLASQMNRVVSGASAAPAQHVDIRLSAAEIDWSYAVIERLDPVTLKNSLLPFNLGALVLDHDASQDLELQPGDVVTIFSQADIRVPIAQQTKFVKLEGEIVSSGTYSVHKGETLRQLIQRAGGLTPNAYLFGSEFTRESTRVLQQQRLDEYVNQLGIDMQRQGTNRVSSAISADEAAATVNAMAGQKEMLARLRLVRATGRIVIEIKPDASNISAIPDIGLEDGDEFVVPSVPGSVNVVGAVYDQNAFLFNPTRRVQDYLHLAGGPNRNADSKHAFVIRADGSVYSKDNTSTLWGNTFAHAQVNPGDTIVVPEKLFKPSVMREFIQWSQVFSQLALGAAAIAILVP